MSGKITKPLFWLIDAILPRFCISCEVEGKIICKSCHVNWQTHPRIKARSFSSFSYSDPIARELIRAWKYSFDESAWQIMKQEIIKQDQALLTFCHSMNIKKITWLPLHFQRRNERGFDQAERVANFLGQITGIKVEKLLSRHLATEQQARKTIAERKKIALTKPFKALKTLNEENILLVDDVITTGSTMRSAENILKEIGAGQVFRYSILKVKS